MSKNAEIVSTRYKAYVLRYLESTDTWEVRVLARKVADKHLAQLKGQMLRVPVLVEAGRYGSNEYVKGDATSYAGGYSKDVWLSVEGKRRREPARKVLLDTPENLALLKEQAELEAQISAVCKKFRWITAEDFLPKTEETKA